ncbi:DUF2934 domain-containing protein [Adhaeretor mobilis]|uniref:DUF2934 domain-containing protein n=1 Tax=Adhaeretor mobilis TaxID=1930276 RepID=A0A517MVJ8_9BACT|nr:DUF2934 domain-containing protein [Adhaeretor mobilis]QDS98902.1 hypothetical protein HG15A2_21900 [Adhaeretor mobilis]
MSIAKPKTQVTNDQIAQRAYKIWESRGCPEGDGQDDWQTAAEELSKEISRDEAHETPRGPILRFFKKLRGRAASY